MPTCRSTGCPSTSPSQRSSSGASRRRWRRWRGRRRAGTGARCVRLARCHQRSKLVWVHGISGRPIRTHKHSQATPIVARSLKCWPSVSSKRRQVCSSEHRRAAHPRAGTLWQAPVYSLELVAWLARAFVASAALKVGNIEALVVRVVIFLVSWSAAPARSSRCRLCLGGAGATGGRRWWRRGAQWLAGSSSSQGGRQPVAITRSTAW